MVREEKEAAWDVFLGQGAPPPPKWQKLALFRERVAMHFAAGAFLEEQHSLIYQCKLSHGCDSWFQIITIADDVVSQL